MAHGKNHSSLDKPEWAYVEKVSIEAFSESDWKVLESQRQLYLRDNQAEHVLRLLSASAHDTSFGYMVNNYRHCLQSATMALRDGLGAEDVVVALLHDVGFTVCPANHGDFAASLLGAYISDRNYWMLQHHGTFQNFHSPNLPGVNRLEREKWRGHQYFDWAAEFVAKYDQAACDPSYCEEPLTLFEPLVREIFSRSPVDRRSSHQHG